ncbi:MAG: hypothetical protein GMKNLPBB_00745 [Myxococcota bacterium]|nr:hypothetical protein [Myxococcota bacterium]
MNTTPYIPNHNPEPIPEKTLAEYEKEIILNVLSRANWNISEAARILDVGRSTIYRKLKQYRLHARVAAQMH